MNFDSYTVSYLNVTKYASLLVILTTGEVRSTHHPEMIYRRNDGRITVRYLGSFRQSSIASILGVIDGGVVENLVQP